MKIGSFRGNISVRPFSVPAANAEAGMVGDKDVGFTALHCFSIVVHFDT